MFENQKFLTRGVENEIPSWLINLHGLDHGG